MRAQVVPWGDPEALSALQSAYQVITYIASVKSEIELNKKSCAFLADKLSSLLPGIQKLISSRPDNTIAPTARSLLEMCWEARDFIEQFKKGGGHWLSTRPARPTTGRAIRPPWKICSGALSTTARA